MENTRPNTLATAFLDSARFPLLDKGHVLCHLIPTFHSRVFHSCVASLVSMSYEFSAALGDVTSHTVAKEPIPWESPNKAA